MLNLRNKRAKRFGWLLQHSIVCYLGKKIKKEGHAKKH